MKTWICRQLRAKLTILCFAQIVFFYDCPFKSTNCTSTPVIVWGWLWKCHIPMAIYNIIMITKAIERLNQAKNCVVYFTCCKWNTYTLKTHTTMILHTEFHFNEPGGNLHEGDLVLTKFASFYRSMEPLALADRRRRRVCRRPFRRLHRHRRRFPR